MDDLSFARFDSCRRALSEAPGVNIGAKVKTMGWESASSLEVEKESKAFDRRIGYDYEVAFDFTAKSADKGSVLFKSSNAILYQSSPKSGKIGILVRWLFK